MVLQDSGQLSLVVDVRDPGRQLRVPDHVVAADDLVVGRCPVDQVIGSCEAELALRWLGGIPLHAVLRCDLAEVLLVGRSIN